MQAIGDRKEQRLHAVIDGKFPVELVDGADAGIHAAGRLEHRASSSPTQPR